MLGVICLIITVVLWRGITRQYPPEHEMRRGGMLLLVFGVIASGILMYL